MSTPEIEIRNRNNLNTFYGALIHAIRDELKILRGDSSTQTTDSSGKRKKTEDITAVVLKGSANKDRVAMIFRDPASELSDRSSEYSGIDVAHCISAIENSLEPLLKARGIQPYEGFEDLIECKKIGSGSEKFIRYAFNIPPEVLDRVMSEDFTYAGYRSGEGIMQLVDPSAQLLVREDTLLLGPVFELEPGTSFALRNAGCNVGELVSAQLSVFIEKLLKPKANAYHFGHWSSPLTNETLSWVAHPENLVNMALQSAGLDPSTPHLQSHDGTATLTKQEGEPKFILREMDTVAQGMYHRLAALPVEELEAGELKSLEVPMEQFLTACLSKCETELLEYKSDPERLPKIEKAVNNLRAMMEKITENKSAGVSSPKLHS